MAAKQMLGRSLARLRGEIRLCRAQYLLDGTDDGGF